PGVESVSMVGTGAVLGGGRAFVGLPGWAAEQRLRVNANEIGPSYFATLRTPLVSGREFDDRDAIAAPGVAVVNETLARRLWPGARFDARRQERSAEGRRSRDRRPAGQPRSGAGAVGVRPVLAEPDDDRLEACDSRRRRSGRDAAGARPDGEPRRS